MKPPSRFRCGSSSASAARVGHGARHRRRQAAPAIAAISAGAPSRLAEPTGQVARRDQPAMQSAEIARTAAPQRQPRQGAGDIGRGAQHIAQAGAQHLPVEQERDRVEPGVDLIGLEPADWPGGSPARAPRPTVTVRSMAASRLPCRRPPSDRVSSRLARVAASIMSRLPPPGPPRRAQHRLLADLGDLDIFDQRRERRQLGARRRRTHRARQRPARASVPPRRPRG